jgi:hypothetical protein
MDVHDIEFETASPYIPAAHRQYGLLPRSCKEGGEVFVFPEELNAADRLLAELEGTADGPSVPTYLLPHGYRCYADYFKAFRGHERRCAEAAPELPEVLGFVAGLMKVANRKEDWSVVRYVGPDRGDWFGLTPGQCYYWPCSASLPQYEGVVDDDETLAYRYPCDPDCWEIVEDPTGMVADALAAGTGASDSWEPEPDGPEARLVGMGASLKYMVNFSLMPEEEGDEEDWGASEQDCVDFPCPQCGAAIGFDAWTKLNVRELPDKLQEVLDGSLFEFMCPECGYTAHLVHPCLYMDPDHRACVYLVVNEGMRAGAVQMFDGLEKDDGAGGPGGSVRRIVFDRNQLADKAAIFAAGLDDRPMELLKTAVSGQAKLKGQVMEGEQPEVRFVGMSDDGELEFSVELGERGALSCALSKGAYDLFAGMLDGSPVDKQAYQVDREWAAGAIEVLSSR